MIAEDVRICNEAFGIVGHDFIDSFDDESAEADDARKYYPSAVKFLISIYPWVFPQFDWGPLAKLSAPPVDTWACAYQLPSETHVVHDVRPDYVKYVLRGTKQLLTDFDGEIYVTATKRVAEDQFTPVFRQGLVFYLASIFACSVADDLDMSLKMEEKFERTFRQGKHTTGKQRQVSRLDQKHGNPLTAVRGG